MYVPVGILNTIILWSLISLFPSGTAIMPYQFNTIFDRDSVHVYIYV